MPTKEIQRYPLEYRKLVKKLKAYGIEERVRRGKGSERILLKPEKKGSNKGSTYPVKHHGQGTEIDVPVIKAILRKFEIPEEDFW